MTDILILVLGASLISYFLSSIIVNRVMKVAGKSVLTKGIVVVSLRVSFALIGIVVTYFLMNLSF